MMFLNKAIAFDGVTEHSVPFAEPQFDFNNDYTAEKETPSD
jgi:hypothetical protein